MCVFQRYTGRSKFPMQRLSPFVGVALSVLFIGGCGSNNAPATTQVAPRVASVQSVKPQNPTNFSSKAAGFAIYFPAKAVQTKKPGTSEWGKFDTFMFECKTVPVSYVVIAMTIPPQVDTSDTAHFMDGVQEGLLGSSGATLDKSRNITTNGAQGRELFTSMMGGAAKSRAAIFVTPKMSFQVMAVAKAKEFESQQPQIEKVFRSFRLLGR